MALRLTPLHEFRQFSPAIQFSPWKCNLACFSACKRYLVVAGRIELQVFLITSAGTTASITTLRPPHGIGSEVNAIRSGWLNGKSVVVSVADEGDVIVYNLDDFNETPRAVNNQESSSWGIAISNDLLAVSANNHRITLFSLASLQTPPPRGHVERDQLIGHRNNIPSIEFSPCGKFLLSCSIDQSAAIWTTTHPLCRVFQFTCGEWGWCVRFIEKSSVKSISQHDPVLKSEHYPPSMRGLRLLIQNDDHSSGSSNYTDIDSDEEMLDQANNEGSIAAVPVAPVSDSSDSLRLQLVLFATQSRLFLLDGHLHEQFFEASQFLPRTHLHGMDRLAFLEYIPELSLVLVASQASQCALLRLVFVEELCQYQLIPEAVIPETPHRRIMVGLSCTSFEAATVAHARLALLYDDGRIFEYTLHRESHDQSLTTQVIL